MMKLVLALALFAPAAAVCPNSCSGHGTCGADDVCNCFDNWMMGDGETGDCSDRKCPYGATWVGAPDSSGGNVHGYQECSGKGVCDRSSGQCECFDGYTGKGCARQTCPNDCSGHGTCEYMEELNVNEADHGVLSYGLHSGANSFESETLVSTWDAHKSRACVCDPQYTDVDCSRRLCNKGNDIMDTRNDISDATDYQVQTVTLLGACTDGDGATSCAELTDFPSGADFALTFTSKIGETFTTDAIAVTNDGTNVNYSTLSTSVESALESLPNGVIDNVIVGTATYSAGALAFTVTFTGATVSGVQNHLVVEGASCSSGCSPKLTGLTLASHTTTGTGVTQTTSPDYNSYECGRRGKCDYDSGICECFEGFQGEACGFQTALV